MTIPERVRKGVLRLHSEGMSLGDIAPKMNIKKHTVEGIVKGVQESTETLSDTPQRVFEIPKQPPYMQGVKTVKEGNLELELLLLQEKNKAKELELKAKELELKIAETEYKKTESKELTEREKLKHLGVVELKKIELENKRLADEKKARQQAEVARKAAAAKAAKEEQAHQAKITALQSEIEDFLQEFVDCETDTEIFCSQRQADEYYEQAQALMGKIGELFEDEDYELFTYYDALLYITELFDDDFSNGGFLKSSKAYFSITEESSEKLAAYLEGELGDLIDEED